MSLNLDSPPAGGGGSAIPPDGSITGYNALVTLAKQKEAAAGAGVSSAAELEAATLEKFDPKADYGNFKAMLTIVAQDMLPYLPPGDEAKLKHWLNQLTAAPTPPAPTTQGPGKDLNTLNPSELSHLAAFFSAHTKPEHVESALQALLEPGTTLTPNQKKEFKELADKIAHIANHPDSSSPELKQLLKDLGSDDPETVAKALKKLFESKVGGCEGEHDPEVLEMLIGNPDKPASVASSVAARLAGVNLSASSTVTPPADPTDPPSGIPIGIKVVILPCPHKANLFMQPGFMALLCNILSRIQKIEQRNVLLGAKLLVGLMAATLSMAEESKDDALIIGHLQAQQTRDDAAKEFQAGVTEMVMGALSIVSAVATYERSNNAEEKVNKKDYWVNKNTGEETQEGQPDAVFDKASYRKAQMGAAEQVRNIVNSVTQALSSFLSSGKDLYAYNKDTDKANLIEEAAVFQGVQALLDKLIQTLQQTISQVAQDKSAVQFFQSMIDLAKSYQQLSGAMWGH